MANSYVVVANPDWALRGCSGVERDNIGEEKPENAACAILEMAFEGTVGGREGEIVRKIGPMNAKPRLGPIPKSETVKLTVTPHAALKADLDRYAELHAKTWGAPVDVATLIPQMLETFIARDRGFRRATRLVGTASC